MFRKFGILALFVLVLAACRSGESDTPATGEEAAAPDPAVLATLPGQWEGAIDIAGQELGILVSFAESGGDLSATIDIPAQGAAGLPLEAVALDGDQIHFEIGGVGAVFDGAVAGDSISGDFEQRGATGTFTLARAGDVPSPVVDVTEQEPLPYANQEVSYAVGDTTLTASYTVPEGDGPFPAVVFVAGSGPTDRNWNSPLLPGTNGSAALLADALTRAGYATLRFDKSVTGPNATDNFAALSGKLSMESHRDEVAGAVQFLTEQTAIDTERIYALGNSEGTLHTLNYQLSDPAVPFAGLVQTGAPGRPLSAVINQQISAVLAAEPNSEELQALWEEAVADFVAGNPVELDEALPEAVRQTWAGLVAPANLPFSRELLGFDPADKLAQVAAPVLVLIGQKDIQVDAAADGQALETAAGDNVTFVYPANANHVLKLEEKPVGELGPGDAVAYNAPDRVLDPESLEAILAFLNGLSGIQ